MADFALRTALVLLGMVGFLGGFVLVCHGLQHWTLLGVYAMVETLLIMRRVWRWTEEHF